MLYISTHEEKLVTKRLIIVVVIIDITILLCLYNATVKVNDRNKIRLYKKGKRQRKWENKAVDS